MTYPTPTISQKDFFSLPEVIQLQNIQKTNPPSSKTWQEAEETMILIAARYNAAHFFL